MKLRFWFILFCIWCCSDPLIGRADKNLALIERLPLGQINWTNGVITAKGPIAPLTIYDIDPEGQPPHSAFEKAIHNVIDTLMQLRVDDYRSASHLIAVKAGSRAKVEDMARLSKKLFPQTATGDVKEVAVQMSLYGGFAQLMLPADIRQVQPIKPLNNEIDRHNFHKKRTDSSDAYTGLIVDARGSGAKPSMVPSLIDEKGHIVFGPAYVSREFAVQHGMCQYIRQIDGDGVDLSRVAPKPLLVKGLRAVTPKSCKIVISNADASKLRGKSAHLDFLKRCRVIIVLDEHIEVK